MVQDVKSEGSPTKAEETIVDVETRAKESMSAGKKHFLCSDYPEAVACFQEASSLLAGKHGETAQECGDAYYFYGLSLLELARLENGVLGNALKGVPDADDDDEDSDEESEAQFEKLDLPENEREKLREEVEAAMATEEEDEADEEGDEKEDAKEKEDEKTEEKEEEMKVEEEPETEQKKEEIEVSEAPTTSVSEQPGTSKGSVEQTEASTSKSELVQEDDEEDPDDISNMQLAWEMLELAKVLYGKREKNETNSLLVAQCHLRLGECGLEVENYSQAVDDFLECLALQKEHLEVTDRKLAETHYSLGLAYSFDRRHESALEHYRAALNVLEARVELLEERIANGEGDAEKSSETLAECREVGEIKQLIPDINSKIEDVIAVKAPLPRKLEISPFRRPLPETTVGFGSSSSSPSCSTIPVRKVTPTVSVKGSSGDISHLVRRKRSSPDNEGVDPKPEVEAKKPKQEPNENKENEPNGTDASGDSTKNNDAGKNQTSQEEAGGNEDSATELKQKMAAAGDAAVAMET